ncbi:MAG: DeoR family transcriptional regulator [Candidatus Sungbacteria bacterium]|nr:DeoR family transcriptional regulator [Candidatus Sungbacteria bacterium]
MFDFSRPEEIRIRAVAAAEAVYRVSDAANFDEALKFELRKKSTEVISFAANSSLQPILPMGRPSSADNLYAAVAAIIELLKFGRDLRFVTPENTERVIGAYESIKQHVVRDLSFRSEEKEEETHEKVGPAGGQNSPEVADPLATPFLAGQESAAFSGATNISPDRAEYPEEPAAFLGKSVHDGGDGLDLAGEEDEDGETILQDSASNDEINERRRKMVECVRNLGRAHISDIRAVLDDGLSERTIQRDLVYLADSGLIFKEGDNRWTIYTYDED